MPLSPSTISAAQQTELRSAAQQAAQQAYAPYSGFQVGAAVLLDNGSVITAANVENASFSLGLCAERSAVVRAVAQHGPQVHIVAVSVVNSAGKSCSPCGACRQVLAEFMPPDGIVIFSFDGKAQISRLADLLPFGFYLNHAG